MSSARLVVRVLVGTSVQLLVPIPRQLPASSSAPAAAAAEDSITFSWLAQEVRRRFARQVYLEERSQRSSDRGAAAAAGAAANEPPEQELVLVPQIDYFDLDGARCAPFDPVDILLAHSAGSRSSSGIPSVVAHLTEPNRFHYVPWHAIKLGLTSPVAAASSASNSASSTAPAAASLSGVAAAEAQQLAPPASSHWSSLPVLYVHSFGSEVGWNTWGHPRLLDMLCRVQAVWQRAELVAAQHSVFGSSPPGSAGSDQSAYAVCACPLYLNALQLSNASCAPLCIALSRLQLLQREQILSVQSRVSAGAVSSHSLPATMLSATGSTMSDKPVPVVLFAVSVLDLSSNSISDECGTWICQLLNQLPSPSPSSSTQPTRANQINLEHGGVLLLKSSGAMTGAGSAHIRAHTTPSAPPPSTLLLDASVIGSLQAISLSHASFTAAVWRSLLPALGRLPYLTELNLSHTSIGDEELISLRSMLQSAPRLKTLALSGCTALQSASDIAAIGSTLTASPSLQRISLAGTRLGDRSIHMLSLIHI